MCRKNHLWGCCGCSLGLGLLIGGSMESGFLSLCLGIGLICAGCSFVRRK